MKILRVYEEEVTCAYCKSLLRIEANDVKYEPSHLGKYICKTYYICASCKAKNYTVPESFKKGKEDEYKRIMCKYY